MPGAEPNTACLPEGGHARAHALRGAGIGLRAQHHAALLAEQPRIGWLEAHSENYFAAGGSQRDALMGLRACYPLSLHGVGLSLGSADPLDLAHVRRLRRLIDDFEPALVSEHLSWSSVDGTFLNDLLPMPYTEEALKHLGELSSIGHNKAVAEVMGLKLSGFVAWLMWRGLHLLRIPTFARKCRLFLEWNWAMFFPPDIAHFGYRHSQRGPASNGSGPRLVEVPRRAAPDGASG